ncbi:hypothetical protein FHE65_26210 [Mumia zhuanghuii]|uniref:Uncharacterized protein n=1 Tax=Mumia zhuanghuii TaxID=2585211 RepID=A0A5C4MHV2_9ACTN|nr:hypothetical protein FHE65_26210 [Mumia zhuanghuii]
MYKPQVCRTPLRELRGHDHTRSLRPTEPAACLAQVETLLLVRDRGPDSDVAQPPVKQPRRHRVTWRLRWPAPDEESPLWHKGLGLAASHPKYASIGLF